MKYISIFVLTLVVVTTTTALAMDRYNGFVYCPKIDRNISYGDIDVKTNNSVSELHKFLDSSHGRGGVQGILLGSGRYGPKTEAEVKEFQKANGLEGLGMVGPKTRILIKQRCNTGN